MSVKISIVVCTHNREAHLRMLLDTLVQQDVDCGSYEILVVDNGSRDSTKNVVKNFVHFSNLTYIYEPIIGLSRARNKGWKNAKGAYVAFIDDDARAHPSWVRQVTSDFEKIRPYPDAVGGKILPFYLKPPPPWFDDYLETRTWGEEPRFLSIGRDKYGLSGSNMAFQKKVLKELGGFRTDLGMHGRNMGFGEESDFFQRMALAGKKIYYDPYCIVWHLVKPENYSLAYIARRAFLSGVSRFLSDHYSGQEEKCLRIFARAIRHSLSLPVRLLDSNRKLAARSEVVVSLRHVSHSMGYLWSAQKRSFGKYCYQKTTE